MGTVMDKGYQGSLSFEPKRLCQFQNHFSLSLSFWGRVGAKPRSVWDLKFRSQGYNPCPLKWESRVYNQGYNPCPLKWESRVYNQGYNPCPLKWESRV